MINEKFAENKMDAQALEEVVGGNKYYSTMIYRRNDIGVMDGGKSFFYKGKGISENDAASIVFYKSEFPPSKFEELEKKDFNTFLHLVNAYRNQNGDKFKLHYMNNA
ncbi:MAG: hypothetical protein IJS81_01020 [Selenomonadaceae bacterium]|nr:hypothetical protein [Selenomonadaceae bacterium]